MKRILFATGTIFLTCTAFAQNIATTVPKNYKLESPADYTRYEKNVIETIDWVQSTAPGDSERKKEASAFLLAWISGSSDLTMEIQENIVNFMGTNPELLLVFMGGWTKYALQTRKFSDALNGNVRGIESVIDYYQRNKDLLKTDPNIEAYTQLQKQKKLVANIKGKLHRH